MQYCWEHEPETFERLGWFSLADGFSALWSMDMRVLWDIVWCQTAKPCKHKVPNTEHQIIYIFFNCICIHNTIIYHDKFQDKQLGERITFKVTNSDAKSL